MLKNLFPLVLLAGFLPVCPAVAHAQWVVHALSGTVNSVNGPARNIAMTLADGSNAKFKIPDRTDVSLTFDKVLKAQSTPSSSFRSVGAHVLVYYIGYGDDRTAVSLKDLGAGPFTYTSGIVTHYDKSRRFVRIRVSPTQTASFQLSEAVIVDTGDGVKEAREYTPHDKDKVRITSMIANGNPEAVFVRSRRADE